MTNPRAAANAVALPAAYRQLVGLHATVAAEGREAGLPDALVALVKIRASQLNGCAYCVDLHCREARALGETERRLYLLAAWAETDLYDERERAALALTEAMTELSAHREVPNEVYDRAAKVFSERQLTAVVWAIAVINTFNRFGVTGRHELPADVA